METYTAKQVWNLWERSRKKALICSGKRIDLQSFPYGMGAQYTKERLLSQAAVFFENIKKKELLESYNKYSF
jgi:hypothetical protein